MPAVAPVPAHARRAPVPSSPRVRRAAAPEAPRQDTRVSEKPASRVARHTAPRPAATSRPASAPADLAWPTSFDDWMIDIIRRRALRLNSGARRRGTHGTVRAVELAHILERSKDAEGRWRCALCDEPVTLADLSFDHVLALADGGEHAASNLVPAHRKCNEIKGSEKAQYRVQAVERWLSEWATTNDGAQPRGALRHHLPAPQAVERRYA